MDDRYLLSTSLPDGKKVGRHPSAVTQGDFGQVLSQKADHRGQTQLWLGDLGLLSASL